VRTRRVEVPGWVYWAVFVLIYLASFAPVVRSADGHDSRRFRVAVMLIYLLLVGLTDVTDMRLQPSGGEGLLFIYD
jgi:hypothetical protein